MPVLRAVATAVRGRLAQVFAKRFWVDGFIPLGCDGSRLAEARWPKGRQRSSRVRRRGPGRQDHQPPNPPQILKMGSILKDKAEHTLARAQACNC
jgi:hypothetical protein